MQKDSFGDITIDQMISLLRKIMSQQQLSTTIKQLHQNSQKNALEISKFDKSFKSSTNFQDANTSQREERTQNFYKQAQKIFSSLSSQDEVGQSKLEQSKFLPNNNSSVVRQIEQNQHTNLQFIRNSNKQSQNSDVEAENNVMQLSQYLANRSKQQQEKQMKCKIKEQMKSELINEFHKLRKLTCFEFQIKLDQIKNNHFTLSSILMGSFIQTLKNILEIPQQHNILSYFMMMKAKQDKCIKSTEQKEKVKNIKNEYQQQTTTQKQINYESIKQTIKNNINQLKIEKQQKPKQIKQITLKQNSSSKETMINQKQGFEELPKITYNQKIQYLKISKYMITHKNVRMIGNQSLTTKIGKC